MSIMTHDVFISYSSKNSQTALAVCHVLEQHKIKCWMAPRDIPAGADYGDLIDEAISACRVFVIVFSEPASLSQWVKGELNLAFTESKTIVPYRIDTTALKGAMRLILNQTHWIDAYPDAESKFGELVSAVSNALGMNVQPALVPAAKTYKVGDYYNENGKEGVVFEVDATGCHGKIVGMKQVELQWCTYEEYKEMIVTGATDHNDGMKNMQAIKHIPDWREKYPAFAWCAEQGEDWYLPAIEELEKFTLDDSIYDAVNHTLSQKNGDLLSNKEEFEWYWSSSEDEKDTFSAWSVRMNDGNTYNVSKNNYNYVRAVSAF